MGSNRRHPTGSAPTPAGEGGVVWEGGPGIFLQGLAVHALDGAPLPSPSLPRQVAPRRTQPAARTAASHHHIGVDVTCRGSAAVCPSRLEHSAMLCHQHVWLCIAKGREISRCSRLIPWEIAAPAASILAYAAKAQVEFNFRDVGAADVR